MLGTETPRALLLWMFLSVPCAWLSWYLFYPAPISAFHLSCAVLNLAAILVLLVGWFDDLTDASIDWRDSDDPETTSIWVIVGLAGLFLIMMFLSFAFGKPSTPYWVPMELYPLEVEKVGEFLPFMMALFGTFFSVVPGEEGLKILLRATHKAYEKSNVETYFAFHPASLLANISWAVFHIITGQIIVLYFFTVLVSGIILDSASAKSGTILTNYFVHALFNGIIITHTFLTGGTLTITVS